MSTDLAIHVLIAAAAVLIALAIAVSLLTANPNNLLD